jgi:threonine/homoserine/homoserine lactone efflux protein
MDMPTSFIPLFAFSFAIAFGAVISPGPMSTTIVSQTPRRGWVVGPIVSVSHALLELALVFLITMGLATWMAKPFIQIAIALLGGILLLWMGLDMSWGSWRGKVHLPGIDRNASPLTGRQIMVMGMMATITNPFWYAWWVTVAASYLAQAQTIGIVAVAAFYLGHISADFGWFTFLSTIIGGGRRWITDSLYRGVMGVCGLFLAYLGVVFLMRGLALIMG